MQEEHFERFSPSSHAEVSLHKSSHLSQMGISRRILWQRIGLFLLIAYGLTWFIWIGLHFLGVPGIISSCIGMFGPGIAALVVRLLYREGFADAGLRLSPSGKLTRSYLLAYGLILILAVCGVGLDIVTRQVRWSPETGGTFFLFIIFCFTLLPLPAMILAFGEEFGWRGYLLMRLIPLMQSPQEGQKKHPEAAGSTEVSISMETSDRSIEFTPGTRRAALLIGFIWGLWHLPLLLMYSMAHLAQRWPVVPLYLLMIVPFSVILTWLRQRSQSIWTTTLMHAMLNCLQYVIPLLILPRFLPVETSLGWFFLVLPLLLLASWLLVRRRL